MNTITAPHRTVESEGSSLSYGLSLFIVWALVWLSLLSSCATLEGLRDYAGEKALRLAECQAQDLASKEQTRACLGQYARDLGTKACKDGEDWLEDLAATEEPEEGRPNE